MALVERQSDAGEDADQVDEPLQDGVVALDQLERLLDREECLHRAQQHHADHHDWEDGDGVAGHVHDEQVHRNLWENRCARQ